MSSIAAGVPAETVAAGINERQRETAKLEMKLRQPRAVQPKIDELRAAFGATRRGVAGDATR